MTRYDEWVESLTKLHLLIDRASDSTRRALDQIDCASPDQMPVDYIAKQIGFTERAIEGACTELKQLTDSVVRWLGQWMTEAAAERKVRPGRTVTDANNCDQTAGT